MIEKHIGEVQAVVGLQFDTEKEYIEENEIEYEVFPDPEPVVVKKKAVGEEGEEAEAAEEPPADGDDGEKKKPAFKVEDWKWTVTDRRSKNLPQLFMQSKGIGARHEIKTAAATAQGGAEVASGTGNLTTAINSATLHDAISRTLEEFCSKVIDLRNGTEKYLYQQVVFNLE